MDENACLICGEGLVYLESAKDMTCEICGKTFQSNASCKNGHFICDVCHANPAFAIIESVCTKTKSKNPLEIADEIMNTPAIHMHGPEHHVLVGSALISAYHNAGGEVDLPKALKEMQIRGSKVPGGFCGFAGACGAGISSGIFYSIVTETTPMSGKSWGDANLMTASSLFAIGNVGGPRCCKRDTYISLETAIEFVKEHLGIEMTSDKHICNFYNKNTQCLKEHCNSIRYITNDLYITIISYRFDILIWLNQYAYCSYAMETYAEVRWPSS